MDRYLGFILHDKEDTKETPERLPQIPPFEVINKMIDLESCEESTLCFWMMRFIESGCLAFWRHRLIADYDAEWRRIDVENSLIETYEDMYYGVLLMLFTTYGDIKNNCIKIEQNSVKEKTSKYSTFKN